jgi:hypothetical protein
LEAAARLRDWLLEGPAQLRDGPDAGGVAGTFDASGAPYYVYGEITGYYLHWLADHEPTLDVCRAANAALGWAARAYGDNALPPTRIYLGPAPDDWRNRAQFFFDLAMLVGGLSRAAHAELIDPPTALLARLCSKLSRFVRDGRIVAVRADEGADLPQRWSTLGGPFEAKAASRVLMAREFIAVPGALGEACEREIEAVCTGAAQAPVEMLHPTLYAIEGALSGGDPNYRAGIARWLARVLALENGKGELPESPQSETDQGEPVWRTDVIAQALRVGLALDTDAEVLERFADALVARVRPDGAIAFRPDADPPQINTWCAMFAEQALRWHAENAAVDTRALV